MFNRNVRLFLVIAVIIVAGISLISTAAAANKIVAQSKDNAKEKGEDKAIAIVCQRPEVKRWMILLDKAGAKDKTFFCYCESSR